MPRCEPPYVPLEERSRSGFCSHSRSRCRERSSSPRYRLGAGGHQTPPRSRSHPRGRRLRDRATQPPTLLEQQYISMVEDFKEPQAHRWRVKSTVSISRMHGIDNVTPENIAYIVCLLRHILSSETSWRD
ncbi:hypothetical protein PYCCODRAFT_1104041 [Trametes coccinea BRFM310]|uniref:Uncharacterized protein n=1 Tax=Trametes coccinea (strain BRFM310) TaxID=1353009 RepID=A0A1Y2IBG4_TRAC3|nr:hypothetical protein PYCCODRAFT_1104041 [Trametes coccinea BRFM310]